MVLGLRLGVTQGLRRQAPAGQDTTEAGLTPASGVGLDFHTDLDICSLTVVWTKEETQIYRTEIE